MRTNPDYITIKHYLEGKLDHQAMHDFEKRALDDPFLADALEGYSFTGTHYESQLSILQRQLEERIIAQQENKNLFNFTWQRLSIAAAAGLMFIIAGILFWMNSFHTDTKLAANQKKVDVNLSPPFVSKPADTYIIGHSKKLSEIVTVYFADVGAAKVQPETGWQSYGEYIKKNIRFPKGENAQGDVIVGFNVNHGGRPGNFKIVKGLTEAYNAEVIRLIKEGSEWIPSRSEKMPEIRIQIKFQH